MGKILQILVVSILVLSGIGTVAIPNMEYIEYKPQIKDDWELEIKIQGGLLGYQLIIENIGNIKVKGNLSMNISTDGFIMLKGRNLKFPLCPNPIDLSPGEKEIYNPGPVIGFGSAIITIEGEFKFGEDVDIYSLKTIGNGFIFLIFTTFETITITIP